MPLVLSLLGGALFMLTVYLGWDSLPHAMGATPLLFLILAWKLGIDLGLVLLWRLRGASYPLQGLAGLLLGDMVTAFLYATLLSALAGTLFSLPPVVVVSVTRELGLLLAGAASVTGTVLFRVYRMPTEGSR